MRATSGEATMASTHEPCTVVLYRASRQDALLRRARGEYREMPGMRLTIEQAMRLWNLDRQACATALNSLVASRFLDRQTCQALLSSLVDAHFLEIDLHGRYRKAHLRY